MKDVLSKYTPEASNSFMEYFEKHDVKIRQPGDKGPPSSDLEANIDNFFPFRAMKAYIEKLKSEGSLSAAEEAELRKSLSDAARNLEKSARRVFGEPTFVISGVVDPKQTAHVALPYTGEEGLIVPASSSYTPNILSVREDVDTKSYIDSNGGATVVKYNVFYVSHLNKTYKLEGKDNYTLFMKSELFRQSPGSSTLDLPSPDILDIVYLKQSTADDAPFPPPDSDGVVVVTPFQDGNMVRAGLVTLASSLASRAFRVDNPLVALLINNAVAQATDTVSTEILTRLGIPPAALPTDFATRLGNGMAAGLTALVATMVMSRITDIVGLDGLAGQAVTGVVSRTASSYVVGQMGLSLADEAVSLSSAFHGALMSVPADIIGNQFLNAMEIRNPTARLAGNVASAIVLASNAGGPVVAAAAMVITTVVFNAIGIGSNSGPYGYVDLLTVNGLYVAGPPRKERHGFKGPAEQLTMKVELLMNQAVPVLNGVLEQMNIQAVPLSGLTSFRFYLFENEIRSIVDGDIETVDASWNGTVTIDFIERVLRKTPFVLPVDADPILAEALRRGWYDWIIRSSLPDFRASLPVHQEIYDLYDMLVAVANGSGSITPPRRPPTGSYGEILLGLHAQMRTATTGVRQFLSSYILAIHNSTNYTGSGNVRCFDC